MTPCLGHADLYDIALFDDAPAQQRQQAVHRAAALCATCPNPCEQKVTTDSAPVELVLLEPDWMPPQREGRPDLQPRAAGRKRTRQPDTVVDQDYVPASRRVAAWASMAADRAALSHPVADIAADLCVSEDTARQLITIGRAAYGHAPAA